MCLVSFGTALSLGQRKVGGFTCQGAVLFLVLLEQSSMLWLSRVVLLGSKLRAASPPHRALTIPWKLMPLCFTSAVCSPWRFKLRLTDSCHLESQLFTTDSHFLSSSKGTELGTGSPVLQVMHQSDVQGPSGCQADGPVCLCLTKSLGWG